MEKFFPPIITVEDARNLAKRAGYAGLFFAGLIVLNAAILFFTTDTLPGFDDYMDPVERNSALVFMGIESVLVLLLSWRVWTGRGYVSGILLLILFVIEVGFKMATNPGSLFWIVFYAAIALYFVNGVRATLARKRVSRASASIESF